jgi:hypothetical protein
MLLFCWPSSPFLELFEKTTKSNRGWKRIELRWHPDLVGNAKRTLALEDRKLILKLMNHPQKKYVRRREIITSLFFVDYFLCG